MAQQYRYPLTRVCLRGGTMTLPRLMLGLFPESGEVVVVDTEAGSEHHLEMSHPRVVAGLGPLYRQHDLDVNDELLITARPDGRFDVTPLRRPRAEDVPTRSAPAADAVAGGAEEPAGSPATAPEAGEGAGPREAPDADVPSAPPGAPAPGATPARDASMLAEGAAGQAGSRAATASQQGLPFNLDPRAATPEAASALAHLDDMDVGVRPEAATRPREVGEGEGGAGGIAGSGGSSGSVREDAVRSAEERGAEAGADPGPGPGAGPGTGPGTGSGNMPAGQGSAAGAEAGAVRGADSGSSPAAARFMDASSVTAGGSARSLPTQRGASASPAAANRREGRGAAFEEEQDNGASLAAVALTSRLRRILGPLGYRFEPLGAGVLYLHAEMGRRTYKVLVQLLRSGERLDWAALLARRRASPANYLSVVGDRADLIRLTSPADLARATLWSWEALERLAVLHESVPVNPIDLESHFGRDGLFDQGLKRFEQGVAARVAERGATSELLTRLASRRAPSVFLLEDLAQDAGMSRDAVLRILERLSEPPFHLIARVDQGEFLLRQPVANALTDLAVYADSLRQRLPQGRREVLTGLEEPGAVPGDSDGSEWSDGSDDVAPAEADAHEQE